MHAHLINVVVILRILFFILVKQDKKTQKIKASLKAAEQMVRLLMSCIIRNGDNRIYL